MRLMVILAGLAALIAAPSAAQEGDMLPLTSLQAHQQDFRAHRFMRQPLPVFEGEPRAAAQQPVRYVTQYVDRPVYIPYQTAPLPVILPQVYQPPYPQYAAVYPPRGLFDVPPATAAVEPPPRPRRAAVKPTATPQPQVVERVIEQRIYYVVVTPTPLPAAIKREPQPTAAAVAALRSAAAQLHAARQARAWAGLWLALSLLGGSVVSVGIFGVWRWNEASRWL